MLLEVALRLFPGLTGHVRGTAFDSELGFRLIPGLAKTDPLWSDRLPATTNSLGWRDAEFPLQKAVGRTRILALGDSFTFGTGVDYGFRFSEVLESQHPTVDVFNTGVFAYGPEQEVRVYEVHGRSLRSDIVVINLFLGNDLNDIRDHVLHGVPKPYFSLSGDSLRLTKPQADLWILARSKSYLAESVFRFLERRESKAQAPPAGISEVNLLLALMKRLAFETREDGSKLLIVIIHPRRATAEERSYQAAVSAALASTGYAVLDLRSVFPVETEPLADQLYLADGHWSAAGHALFADALAADLAVRGWLPK